MYLVPILRYSVSNNGVMKHGLGDVQDYSK